MIGDRGYCDLPESVAILGQAAIAGLMDGGVLPVIKHIPGHGRATSDSHDELPVAAASLANCGPPISCPSRRMAERRWQ